MCLLHVRNLGGGDVEQGSLFLSPHNTQFSGLLSCSTLSIFALSKKSNPIYLGRRDQEVRGSQPVWAKNWRDGITTNG
jgi:hypothetical protein